MGTRTITGTEKCLAAKATVSEPHAALRPPFANTLWVPIITLFTLDIIENIAESGITVVSIFDLANEAANV